MRIMPVSVCHHVSTIGQRSPPIVLWYHRHASGLIGSPTVPRRRRLERSCFFGHSSPQRMNARIAVGAVYRIVMSYSSTIRQNRSGSGQSGAPSYMKTRAPFARGPYTMYDWRVPGPVPDRARTEAPEDHAVHGADAGASEHRDRELRDHGHVDRDPVPPLHAQAFEDVREATDLPPHAVVRQDSAFSRLALPDERGLVPTGSGQMTVQAIRGDVELSVEEPLGEGRVPLEGLRPGGDPVEFLRHARPEGPWILRGVLAERVVLQVGALSEGLRRRVLLSLL